MAMKLFQWVRNLLCEYKNHSLSFRHNTNKDESLPSSSSIHVISTCSSPIDDRIFPDNVIAKFFENLCVRDIARMRLVCKQWRSILSRLDSIKTAQEPPWLILSEDSYLEPETFLTEIRFKRLPTEETYRFEFPKMKTLVHGGWCCGHSNGWLLIAVGTRLDPDLFLWNPLSGSTHELPPTSTLPFFDWFVDDCRKFGLFDNISSLISRVQVFKVGFCVVVAVIFSNPAGGMADELALCTLHENSWSVFRGEKNESYDDILFHQGKLHVLAKSDLLPNQATRKMNYTVHLTNCQLEVQMLHLVYKGPTDYASVAPPGFGISKSGAKAERLVQSSTTNELLLVTTLFDHCAYLNWHQGPIGSFQCTQTREFQIRRLTIGDCVRLERLNSIGEQAIFLGKTSSFSLPAAAINGVGDRIYFATDDAEGLIWKGEVYTNQEETREGNCYTRKAYEDEIYVAREQGVFMVQENRIIRNSLKYLVFPSGSITGWFMPKLF